MELTAKYLANPTGKYTILWPLDPVDYPNPNEWFIVITSPKLRENFLQNAVNIFGLDSIFKINQYKYVLGY